MRPAGYPYKFVASGPAWFEVPAVVDICSVSGCISRPFVDYLGHWRHNGYWMFDSPAIMEQIALQDGIELTPATLFYYDVHEEEFDEPTRPWMAFAPDASFTTSVQAPRMKECLGYDVVTFSVGTLPECSPLSCKTVAAEMAVNEHCPFASLDEARIAVDRGVFANTEPGLYRIFCRIQTRTVMGFVAVGFQCSRRRKSGKGTAPAIPNKALPCPSTRSRSSASVRFRWTSMCR
jgi:hypothetical protein